MKINLYLYTERVALFDINEKVTSKKSCQLTKFETGIANIVSCY